VSVFVAIIGLGALILVHEAGHFFTALAVGMKPRRFYLGFPPALVKWQRRGIEYGIGAIPLGGFVKIPGMHRPAAGDLDMWFGRALRQAPQLVRRVEPVKRPLAEGDLARAREQLPALTAEVEAADLSVDAKAAAERGLRELADGLSPEAYWRQRPWKRIAVIAAGPLTNLVLALALFTALFMAGGGRATRNVESVVPGTPAQTVGLQAGDRIETLNGRPLTAGEIPSRISGSHGRPLTLVVARDGRRVVLGPVRPRLDQGAYRLGFVLRGERLAAPAAAWRSVRLTGDVTRAIAHSLSRLVSGSGRKDVSSPVGIVQGSSDALNQGAQDFLWVMGLISLSLALLNLLPLLPLDGGHILFSIVEGVRGRAVRREVYERVSAFGLAVVVLLFVIGLSNDIGRLGQ
jgi:regulator of sigma E protease